jgi:predicted DNA-binding protein
MAKAEKRVIINISTTMYDKLSMLAAKLGLTIPAYIRYLIANEMKGRNS